MKPMLHPPIESVTVEGILHALSDPVRAAIFAELAGSDGTHTCSTFLTVRDKSIPKSTLSQHFKVLRDAGLIRSERAGVEMRSTSRCAELDARFPGLLAAIVTALGTQQRRKSAKARKKAA
jgi:DNA-binding transcriptional ArsR family regulator